MTDITDCGICWGRFVEPKMLPCQHTFCLKCLRQLTEERNIRCPQCRAEHAVPWRGVSGFPNNLLMMSLLSSPTHIKMPCKDCNSGRDIQENCEHCNRYLCDACLHLHIQEVTDKMDTKMETLKNQVPIFESHVEEMYRRKEKAEPTEKKIKKWEKKRINEVHTKATSLIAEVHSRVKFDASSLHNALDITAEIKEFQENLTTEIKQAKKMSEVLRQQEKLKSLKERSEALATAMKHEKVNDISEVTFDLEEAKLCEPLAYDEQERSRQAASQLLEIFRRQDILLRSLDEDLSTMLNSWFQTRFAKWRKILKQYADAIDSCKAGNPVDIDSLPSDLNSVV